MFKQFYSKFDKLPTTRFTQDPIYHTLH